jgi:predicted transcriptional regulator
MLMTLKSEQGKTVRPGEVLRLVFGLGEEEIKMARVVKLKDLLLTNDY